MAKRKRQRVPEPKAPQLSMEEIVERCCHFQVFSCQKCDHSEEDVKRTMLRLLDENPDAVAKVRKLHVKGPDWDGHSTFIEFLRRVGAPIAEMRLEQSHFGMLDRIFINTLHAMRFLKVLEIRGTDLGINGLCDLFTLVASNFAPVEKLVVDGRQVKSSDIGSEGLRALVTMVTNAKALTHVAVAATAPKKRLETHPPVSLARELEAACLTNKRLEYVSFDIKFGYKELDEVLKNISANPKDGSLLVINAVIPGGGAVWAAYENGKRKVALPPKVLHMSDAAGTMTQLAWRIETPVVVRPHLTWSKDCCENDSVEIADFSWLVT